MRENGLQGHPEALFANTNEPIGTRQATELRRHGAFDGLIVASDWLRAQNVTEGLYLWAYCWTTKMAEKQLPYAYCCAWFGWALEPLLFEAVLRPEFTPPLKKKRKKKRSKAVKILTECDLSPRIYTVVPTTTQSLEIRQSRIIARLNKGQ